MEHIEAKNGTMRRNSETCTAIEYMFENEKNINSAVIELNGRYPEIGFALNEICEEIIYVVEGFGHLMTFESDVVIKKGDMLRIKPDEKYFLDGKLKLVISSSPAWYPEQYRNISV